MATVSERVTKLSAKIAGGDSAMDAIAERVKAAVESNLAGHNKSHDFADSIKIGKGRIDRVIYTDDEAALSIEYGHATTHGAGREGPRRWVPGLFAFTNAAKGM